MNDREAAKRVIYELVKENGGTLVNKTNLFKAFVLAHLYYADTNPGFLSHWPIVKMPQGPGIDKADELLGEMMTEGILRIEQEPAGDFKAFKFQLTGQKPIAELPDGWEESIKVGVDAVKNKTATKTSQESHEWSTSWQRAKSGQELDIYVDLLTDNEVKRLDSDLASGAQQIKQLWG